MTTPFNTDPPLVEPPYLAHRRSVEDVEKLDPKVGWIAGGVALVMLLLLIFAGIKSSSNTVVGLSNSPAPLIVGAPIIRPAPPEITGEGPL
jgi:hypothetical protein